MSALYAIALTVAIALVAIQITALLKPEWFE